MPENFIRLCFAFIVVGTFLLFGCDQQQDANVKGKKMTEKEITSFSATTSKNAKRLLFIHHSCGGQWLADAGEQNDIIPDTSLHISHPNGGGLRKLLINNGYEVHEAGYKSKIAEKTDVNDWNAKFRDQMDVILRTDQQDKLYSDTSSKNGIIVFKSCFPNSEIESEGKEPGDPDSPMKTTANYKAAYNKLLSYFEAHPDTLFVCVTAPPVVGNVPSRTMEFLKNLIGAEGSVKAMGARIRRFNNWLKDTEKGWLAGYRHKNVVVFDYYDVLTKHGESDHLLYLTDKVNDSHPSAEGNSIAAQEFVVFLNQMVKQ